MNGSAEFIDVLSPSHRLVHGTLYGLPERTA